jgi:hypothetical protein
MSYEDIARQDERLADEIKDNVERGWFAHEATYGRLEVLHPLRDEVFLTLRDSKVELQLFADWVTSLQLWERRHIAVEELHALLRTLQGLDFSCKASLGADSPLMSAAALGPNPCEILPHRNGRVGDELRCEILWEGKYRQHLTLDLECPAGPTSDGGEILHADLSFGFAPGDGIDWVRTRYEAKYGSLGLDGVAP